jgi:hypothetical protein
VWTEFLQKFGSSSGYYVYQFDFGNFPDNKFLGLSIKMCWITATFGIANSTTDMKKIAEGDKNGDVVLNFLNVSQLWKAGGHEEMSPILADQ